MEGAGWVRRSELFGRSPQGLPAQVTVLWVACWHERHERMALPSTESWDGKSMHVGRAKWRARWVERCHHSVPSMVNISLLTITANLLIWKMRVSSLDLSPCYIFAQPKVRYGSQRKRSEHGLRPGPLSACRKERAFEQGTHLQILGCRCLSWFWLGMAKPLSPKLCVISFVGKYAGMVGGKFSGFVCAWLFCCIHVGIWSTVVQEGEPEHVDLMSVS